MMGTSPKTLLIQRASLPARTLASTPLASVGNGITGALNKVALALPELPALPASMPKLPTLPAMPASAASKVPLPIISFVKDVEIKLPTGVPSIAAAISPPGVTAPALGGLAGLITPIRVTGYTPSYTPYTPAPSGGGAFVFE